MQPMPQQFPMTGSKGKKLAWAAAGLYALFIFALSSIPGRDLPRFFVASDKALHFFEYLPFGLLCVLALSKSCSRGRSQTLLISIFVVFLYALSDEIHQLFVPGRQFDMMDVFFDVSGALAGGILLRWPR